MRIRRPITKLYPQDWQACCKSHCMIIIGLRIFFLETIRSSLLGPICQNLSPREWAWRNILCLPGLAAECVRYPGVSSKFFDVWQTRQDRPHLFFKLCLFEYMYLVGSDGTILFHFLGDLIKVALGEHIVQLSTRRSLISPLTPSFLGGCLWWRVAQHSTIIWGLAIYLFPRQELKVRYPSR